MCFVKLWKAKSKRFLPTFILCLSMLKLDKKIPPVPEKPDFVVQACELTSF